MMLFRRFIVFRNNNFRNNIEVGDVLLILTNANLTRLSQPLTVISNNPLRICLVTDSLKFVNLGITNLGAFFIGRFIIPLSSRFV